MNQGKLSSHFLVQLETLKIYHNQGWTISYTDNQSWEWKQFNLNTRERPFTYTRRGLSVLPTANCQSLQIRQLRCPAKINRIAVLVVFVILSGRCGPVFAPLNSRIQSTIHFSTTVRLSAPVQQNKLKLKFCLLFHQTCTWLRGVNGFLKQSRLF